MYSASTYIFLSTHFFVRTSYFASMLRNFWLRNWKENSMTLEVPELDHIFKLSNNKIASLEIRS